jgi:hypothetical protein
MKLFNQEIHDNLIALGYERYERYKGPSGKKEDQYDMYWHLVNDDWFGINSEGHIDPMDLCDFTQGSVKGRRIYEEWINNGKSGVISFVDLSPKIKVRATLSFTKHKMKQQNLPYDIEEENDSFKMVRLTEH